MADVAAAFEDVVRSEAPLLRSLWNDLSAQQQDVLRVVVLGVEQLYSAQMRDQYGLPGASSVSKAGDGLTRRGVLVQGDAGAAFHSPFFKHWVRTEMAADLD